MNKIFTIANILFILFSSLSVTTYCQTIGTVSMRTTALPPTNPILRTYINNNSVSTTATLSNSSSGSTLAYIFGRVVSLSDPNFFISTRVTSLSRKLSNGIPVNFSGSEIFDAFGKFDPNNLMKGPGASAIDLNNIVLPDGMYNVCFFADCTPTAGQCPTFSNTGCATIIINCAGTRVTQINTLINPPLNPIISQSISQQRVLSNIQFSAGTGCVSQAQIKVFGKLERISPSPFTITVDPFKSQIQQSVLISQSPLSLTSTQQLQAFNNFNESGLLVSGIELSTLKDATNNIKLPDGIYRLCYFAYYLNSNGTLGTQASNPNLGCATFTICNNVSAPQFIQPVNNLNISSAIPVIAQTSPVVFSWTPPQSSCGFPPGGYLYDFEIREFYPNQGPQDAINNPFVFRKFSLPSNTFLLDTMLNRYVLQRGKRYVVRVRAIGSSSSTPISIDNNGYSRTEAFQYGENVDITTNTPFGAIDPTLAYLKFNERKADYWDDAYTELLAGKRSDALVPIKEYISFKLMQNGIGYGLDAIEIFYLLNPELINEKMVRLSYKAKMPVLPVVDGNKLKNFAIKQNGNMQPDPKEVNSYKLKVDSLSNLYTQNMMPENMRPVINTALMNLNRFSSEAANAERVTINTINKLLAELIFAIKTQPKTGAPNNTNHITEVVNDLVEITAQPVYASAFNANKSDKKMMMHTSLLHTAAYTYEPQPTGLNIMQFTTRYEDFYFASKDRVLPFDIVVYRSKTPPAGPVLAEPNLNEAYRIFYTPSSLYNNRNPDINALVSPDLSSTTQVPLPQTLGYKFWTLNMVNHSRTNATNVEVKDIFINNRKKGSTEKRLSILLKVN